MNVEIRDLDHEDLDIMAIEMRPMDRMEFEAMSGGKSLEENLEHLLLRSDKARTFYVDGELVAIYGVIRPTILSTIGNPWLAATSEVTKPAVRRKFYELTRPELADMAIGYTHWWNVIAEENKIAIRWLKWIGFEFTGEEYIVAGVKFLRFKLEE